MFKNDRMMMILTGLVLAIFAGTLVKYGDQIMALMSGETEIASQDDSYSVRAGSLQILDVQSNDTEKGPIVVLSRPNCGTVELTGNNKVSFSSDEDCQGEVEFAYCVDSDGICEPNTVKINVISVNVAAQTRQAGTTSPTSGSNSGSAAENNAGATGAPVVVATRPPQPAGESGSAPAVGTISAFMAPPALASPSIPELVSPGIAMASIRQSSGGLIETPPETRNENTDRNIARQDSAQAAQAATIATSAFEAPSISESSNISLGGGTRDTVASVAAPQGLEPGTSGDKNITNLERGPVALAALQNRRNVLPAQEAAPLAAKPERSDFSPVETAAAPTSNPLPDSRFSAAPRQSGPIALIALQGGTGGNTATAGERLNVILSEPGEQIFTNAKVPPASLAPTSDGLTEVSVLEREPGAVQSTLAPQAPRFENAVSVLASALRDRPIARLPLASPRAPDAGSTFGAPQNLAAALPNQINIPGRLSIDDRVNGNISVSMRRDSTRRAAEITLIPAPADIARKPQLDLTPAQTPQFLQASLPATPAPQGNTAPAQLSACDIVLSANAGNGAMIALEVSAPCKPSQILTIEHAGLAFSVLSDANGEASLSFPAMQQQAEITVRYADQSFGTTTVTIDDIDRVLRAGVSWISDMDLDLNAFEYGAAVGAEGHVSADAPRDYRSSRIKGGGYLLQLGDPSLARGSLAEVYTIPVNRNQQRGTVALSVLIKDTSLVCGQTIIAKTARSREGRSAGIRNVRFTVPACGTVAQQIALPGAIDDIRLAGR